MKDLIGRTATALDIGASVDEIYFMLKEEGLNEYQIFLTYKAGQILLKGRQV